MYNMYKNYLQVCDAVDSKFEVNFSTFQNKSTCF